MWIDKLIKNEIIIIPSILKSNEKRLLNLLLHGEIISSNDLKSSFSILKKEREQEKKTRQSLRLFEKSQKISGIKTNTEYLEIKNIIHRTGRIDVVLKTEFFLKRPLLFEWKKNFEIQYIFPLQKKYKLCCKLSLLTFGYLITPIGVTSQPWHQDSPSKKKFSYLTVFIALTESTKKNGTIEILEKNKKSNISQHIEFYPGEGILFSGNLIHRGTANHSNKIRYLFYLVYSTKKKDANV